MKEFIRKNKILCLAPVLAIMMLFASSTIVSANTLTGWYTVIDNSTNTLLGFVVDDKVGSGQNTEEHYSTGIDTNCGQIKVDGSTITSSGIGKPTAVGDCIVRDEGAKRQYLAWTWPASRSVDANARDREMAEWVNATLVDSFNLAIQKTLSENGIDTFRYESGLPKVMNNLATDVHTAANGGAQTFTHSVSAKSASGSFSKKSYTYTFRPATKSDLENNGYSVSGNNVNGELGWNLKSFVVMTVGNSDNEIILPWRAPKGYAEGQRLDGMYDDLSDIVKKPNFISWSHIAYQSSYSYFHGITAKDTDTIFQPSGVETVINNMIGNIVGGITSFLGFYSIEELTLNRGIRSITYYKGLMPRTWFNGAALVYWIFQVIGIFVIGIGFIKLMIEKNLAVVNPGKRVEIMDSLIKIFISAGMMLMFIPFFTILATVNELFVATMNAMVPTDASLSFALSGGTWIGILVQIAFIFILFKINITYIVRAVTILILYSGAPLFIAFYAMGESGKNRFQIWLKELVVNIFMQLFNAIMTTIFLLTLSYTSLRAIERIALLMTYVGLSDYFKSTLMDAGSGTDRIADKASSAMATMGGTALAGAVSSASNLLRGKNSTGEEKGGALSSSGRVANNNEDVTAHMDADQAKAYTKANTPERGGIGRVKNVAKKAGRAIDEKLSTSKGGEIYGLGKDGAKAMGSVGKSIFKATKVPRHMMASAGATALQAGTVLGMEAVGANSFEARRGLTRALGSFGEDAKSMVNGDFMDDAAREWNDFMDGDTSDREQNISGVALSKDAGLAKISTRDSAITANDGKDCYDEYGNEMEESYFASGGEKYVDMTLAASSDAYRNLNNDDTRQSAMAGIQEMMDKNREYYNKPDLKYEYIREKTGKNGHDKIVGIRMSAGDKTKARSYANGVGTGKEYKISSKSNITVGNPKEFDYQVKGLGAYNVNNYTNKHVQRLSKLKQNN